MAIAIEYQHLNLFPETQLLWDDEKGPNDTCTYSELH